MNPNFLRILFPVVALAAAPSVHAQLSDSEIDAIAGALENEPSFKDGGHQGKIGYYFIRLFKMDWPVKDEDVRDSWDIDPEQDTDEDGIPDVDDDDIDGDGIKNFKDPDIDGDGKLNREDESPYDSTKCFEDPMDIDTDLDGVPDILDSFPEDPEMSFESRELEQMKETIVDAMFAQEARSRRERR